MGSNPTGGTAIPIPLQRSDQRQHALDGACRFTASIGTSSNFRDADAGRRSRPRHRACRVLARRLPRPDARRVPRRPVGARTRTAPGPTDLAAAGREARTTSSWRPTGAGSSASLPLVHPGPRQTTLIRRSAACSRSTSIRTTRVAASGEPCTPLLLTVSSPTTSPTPASGSSTATACSALLPPPPWLDRRRPHADRPAAHRTSDYVDDDSIAVSPADFSRSGPPSPVSIRAAPPPNRGPHVGDIIFGHRRRQHRRAVLERRSRFGEGLERLQLPALEDV